MLFGTPKLAEDALLEGLKPLNIKAEEMKSIHPVELKDSILNSFLLSKTLSNRHPWHVLGLLANFRIQLDNLISQQHLSKSAMIDYRNPLILEPLLKLRSYPILPENENLFLKFHVNDMDGLKNPLERVKLIKDQDRHDLLQLFHGEEVLVEIYSEKNFLQFIEFVMNSALGTSIQSVLQSLPYLS